MSDRVEHVPTLALSVRQPWAWAIIHAGKDIENRSWQAVNYGLRQRGHIAIHAAKGMARHEYDDAKGFMRQIIGIECPAPADLLRGGIIGSVEVVDVVCESKSPWFFGPRGLVLRNPEVLTFIPAVGALGYFAWRRDDALAPSLPAQWMLKSLETSEKPKPPKQEAMLKQPDLFIERPKPPKQEVMF